MTAYSCQKHDRDDRVTIPLLDGRTLMLGRPCAFVSLADSASLHKPLATTRAILSIQSNSINGLRKFKHILAHMSGRHVYRLNTRTVIARIRNLVNTHRLVALLLPPLTTSEYSADGSGLNMAPAAIKDGVEIEKIIITAKTLFEDLKTLSAKLKYVVSTVGNHILKKETAEKFAKALTTNAIVATVAVLVIWAGSHFVAGAGLAIDAVMIAVGWIFIGWGIFNLVKDMIKLFFVIKKANSLDELDAASKKLADILVQFGADVIIGLLTRGAGKLKRNADTKRDLGADDVDAGPKPKKEKEKAPPKTRDETQQEIVDRMGKDIKNHPLRKAYEDDVADLARYKDKIKPNMTNDELEAIAREASQARRDLGVKYKDVTPQPLRDYIYDRNLEVYKDPLGPKFEDLLKSKLKKGIPKDQALKDIIGSSSRPNGDINRVMGDFNKWLSAKPDSYIMKFGGG